MASGSLASFPFLAGDGQWAGIENLHINAAFDGKLTIFPNVEEFTWVGVRMVYRESRFVHMTSLWRVKTSTVARLMSEIPG